MRQISLRFDSVTVTAELFDTPTAAAVWQALPITSQVQTWGEEVYFTAGVGAAAEADARAEVEAGELAYWLAGDAIAICFGPTPVSTADQILLISEANIWGRLTDDPRALAAVAAGETVEIIAA